MPAPMRFGGSTVEFPEYGAVTTLPDGQRIIAAPEDNDAYRATAGRLGYGDDVLRMCREHEAAHAALAAWLLLPESPTLRVVAGEEGPSDLTGAEERLVLALQDFANRAGVDLLDVFARRHGPDRAASGGGARTLPNPTTTLAEPERI